MAARKKPSRKKTVSRTRKTAAKKAVSKKKATRKAAKKTAGRRSTKKKKTTKKIGRKKTAKKKAAKKKKKTVRKKVSKKKVTKKKASKKKPSRKKTSKTKAKKKPSKKRTSSKKVTSKTARKTTGKSGSTKASAKKKKKVTKRITAVSTPAKPKPVRPVRKRRKINPDALIHGIEPYSPKKGEEYMSDSQLEHFRRILLAWKQELMQEVDRTVHHMQDEASNFPDPNDRATQESEFGLELRTRDRERKLLKKIAQAIARVDDGSYGFCEETGEEIGLQRLEARPVATLSVEAQERRELAERQYSDRDDQYR